MELLSSARPVWGIDIGFATIKAVKVRRAGDTVEILDFDVIELEHAEDEAGRDANVRAGLVEITKRRKIGGTPVVLAVPGNLCFFRPFTLPPVEHRRVREIVGYEARQRIPSPLEEVLWDFRTSTPTPGGEVNVNLIAIRKEIVEGLLETARELGLHVAAIQAAPLALYNFVRHEMRPPETVLVLDAGSKVTDFVVVAPGSFWFRPLPVSGADVTRLLAQKFRIPFEEAENLKLKMADSKQAEKIFQVIEPALLNLAGEIQRTSGYYKSLARDTRLDTIYAVGQSFRLPGLTEFLSQNLEAKVEPITEITRIRLAEGADQAWFKDEFQSMAVAIGLGLQGVGLGEFDLDLLPRAERIQNLIRQKRWAGAACVAVLACAVGAAGFAYNRRAASVKDLIERGKKVQTQIENWDNKRLGAERGLVAHEAHLRKWSEAVPDRVHVRVLEKVMALKDADGRALFGGRGAPGRQRGIWIRSLWVGRPSDLRATCGDDPALQRGFSPRFASLASRVAVVLVVESNEGGTEGIGKRIVEALKRHGEFLPPEAPAGFVPPGRPGDEALWAAVIGIGDYALEVKIQHLGGDAEGVVIRCCFAWEPREAPGE